MSKKSVFMYLLNIVNMEKSQKNDEKELIKVSGGNPTKLLRRNRI